jgi:C1A family cysteine protease
MLSLHSASLAATPLYTTEAAARASFESFKTQFGKKYSVEEEETRFATFMGNLKVADQRNAEDTAEHGITKFMDLTPQEFKQMYLGYTPPAMRPASLKVDVPELPQGAKVTKDWTGHYTTPVKDQGRCGSCWAFSTVEQIESDAMRELGVTYELSTQQVISCDRRDGGCNGGNTETAYSYIEGAGGLVTAREYPDTSHSSGSTGSCSSSKSDDPVISVKSYHTIGKEGENAASESAMASYVDSTGPLSICVDANKWQTYKGGILSNCPTSLDHCVQAVGINTDSSSPYWKVRNSWNTDWGEDGFIRLRYGHNECGLTHDPTWATVGSVAHERLISQQAAAAAARE